MVATINETLDHLHPVIVIMHLGDLPGSVEITVNMYQESVRADG